MNIACLFGENANVRHKKAASKHGFDACKVNFWMKKMKSNYGKWSEELNVDRSTVNKYLHAMGKVYWMTHEPKILSHVS